MATSDDQIGRNVAECRDRIGMSQKDVAERMRELGWKWSQATVWSVEKGERPLRLAEADDLARRVFSISAGEFTQADGFTRTQSAMQTVYLAHGALKDAIATFMLGQWNLAEIADDADIFETNFRDRVEDWLTMSIEDVAREVVQDEEAKGLKERFLSREIISDSRDADLEAAAADMYGPFTKLLSEHWRPHGIDQTTP